MPWRKKPYPNLRYWTTGSPSTARAAGYTSIFFCVGPPVRNPRPRCHHWAQVPLDRLPEWSWPDICAHLRCTACGSVVGLIHTIADHFVSSSSGGIALTISAESPNSSTRIYARSAKVISRFLTTLSAEISVRVRRPTLIMRSEKWRLIMSASLKGERLRSRNADRAYCLRNTS
jgi:hypothetical protein